jgi:phospholipid transport system transporter-binding protein|tara:strand:+ start:4132 stop:4446 length:315 start_codon:yes stop_codon:yes gene_type:complete
VKKISFIEKDSRVVFSGELTLLTIDNSFEKKSKALIKSGVLIFDLSNVSKVDTACLAWLLAMLELSNKTDCQLTFDNLPKDLIKLAQLSCVDMFLPKTDSTLNQ